MHRWTFALAVLIAFAFNVVAFACPMCKESIPNPEGPAGIGGPGSPGFADPSQMSSSSLPGGFNVSVYLMLVGFFVCLALVSWTIIKAVRDTPNNTRGFAVGPTAQGVGRSA